MLISKKCKSQDCDSVLLTNTDKFTNVTKIESELIAIENNNIKLGWQVSISDQKSKRTRIIISLAAMNATGLGCIDDDAQITFLFSDEKKITTTNGYQFNCNGIAGAVFYIKGFVNKPSVTNVKSLASKDLSAVRIKLRNENYDYDFTKEQAQAFKKVMSCAIIIAEIDN